MHSSGQTAAVLAFKNSSRKYIYEKVLNPGIWKLTEMSVGERVWEIEQQNENSNWKTNNQQHWMMNIRLFWFISESTPNSLKQNIHDQAQLFL